MKTLHNRRDFLRISGAGALGMMAFSPLACTTAVVDKKSFGVGLQLYTIRDAMDAIEQSKPIGVFGGRRYGKTVFLNQLEAICFQRGYATTFITCSTDSSLSELLGAIIQGLAACTRAG